MSAHTQTPLTSQILVYETSSSSSNTQLLNPTFLQPDCYAAAWAFKSIGSSNPRPHLVLYALRAPSDLYPIIASQEVATESSFRCYRQIQTFERPEQTNGEKQGIGKVIKCTAIEPGPGMEHEFHQWYRKEHLEQVSRMEGWRKSTRYEMYPRGLLPRGGPRDGEVDGVDGEEIGPPRLLAIHEFEEGTVVRRMKEHEWTDWTRKMVKCAVKIEEGVYEFVDGLEGDGLGL